jgi:uncharacterized protein (TIRG00374 family)
VKGLFRSRPFRVAVSLLLAAGLIAFFLSRVELSAVGQAIGSASPVWLAASLLLGLSTFLLRALRWVWILRPVERTPFFPAFTATAVGFAANTVLPARAGEIIRPALLARQRGLPFSAVLASIVFERILDAATVLLFLLFALAEGLPGASAGSAPVLFASAGRLRVMALVLLLVVAFLVLFAVVWRGATERFAERVFAFLPERWRPKLSQLAGAFLDGFASLRRPRLLLQVVAGSVGMWFVIGLQIHCVLRAFGLGLPLTAAFVVTAAAVLGLAVPTPGGIGGYHAAVQLVLVEVYGVGLATASGVALLAHAISFVPISLIGFLLFALTPTRRKGLKDLAQAPKDGR